MKKDTVKTAAGRKYTEAYEAHYTAKHLTKAIELYMAVATEHPNTPEAEYSRTQVLNIVRDVVPGPDLFAAQLALARDHLGRSRTPDVESAPVAPLASPPS